MAELFLARDTRTEQLVVIKRILPYLSDEAEFVRMFLDEARIAAQLHHTNIIQVHELGKLDESIFIAMELVEGVDLRRLLEEEQKVKRALPPRIAAYVSAQLCAGLYYAHHRIGLDGKPMGIVHRDISPQNVMVGFDGTVKLVDFGIAKAGALVERSKPGVIKGKFLYLAPEQLTQDRVDHRADLFALGSMLYELTTGKSPFQKPTTEAVIFAVRSEDPPPPHLVSPDYPLALSKIVMKCLSKDRERRYQEAEQVQRDLEKFLLQAPTTRADLVSYVSQRIGAEDERTAPLVPRGAGQAPEPNPSLEASTRSLGGGGQPTSLGAHRPSARAQGPESRTRAARSENVAGSSGPPTVNLPARRPSGLKYPDAGQEHDASTTASLVDSAAPVAELPWADAAFDRSDSLPELTPTAHLAGEKSGPTPFDTHPLDGGEVGIAMAPPDDEQSIRDLQAPNATRPTDLGDRLSRSPLVLGSIAAVVVMAIALTLGMIWKRPAAMPRVEPAQVAPPEERVPPEPEPAAIAVEELAPEPAPPPPRPAPSASKRVTVTIRAPSGTRINGGKLSPGGSYQLKPGSLRLVYRCPPKRNKRSPEVDKTFKVARPPRGGKMIITLCKP